jgi:hypothetical protein
MEPSEIENLISALAIQRNRAFDEAARLAARLARAEAAAAELKTELEALKTATTKKPQK